MLVVSIFLIASVLPLFEVFTGEGNSDPTNFAGDDYYVTYSLGALPTLPDGVSSQRGESNGYNYLTETGSSVEVKYDGAAVAEYNPQFWKDNIKSHAEVVGNVNVVNWNPILLSDGSSVVEGCEGTGYESKKTIVFTGWKVENDNSSYIIHPGDRLDKTDRELFSLDQSGKKSLHLVAQWDLLKNLVILNGSCEDTIIKSDSKDLKDSYTNIALINGTTHFTKLKDESYSTIGGWTIRGFGVEPSLIITTNNSSTPEDVKSSLCLSNFTVIDNIKLVGFDNLLRLGTDSALYACGNKLIIGVGVDGNSDWTQVQRSWGMVTAYNGVQIVGGSYNSGNTEKTDLAIFSGFYANIVGGSLGTKVETTNLRILGGTYVGTIYGGNGDYLSINGLKTVDKTNVLVMGGIGTAFSKTHNGVESRVDWQIVLGGSRGGGYDDNKTYYGKVTESNVEVSGKADMMQVMGGGRSGGTKTDSVNVLVSGNAVIRDSVYGASADANTIKGHYPVEKVNTVIAGSATVYGDVFGAGRDTYEEKIVGPSTKNVTLSIEDYCEIRGSVYGGGMRGSIGEQPSDEDPSGSISKVYGDTVVNITVSGGKILGSLFGSGKGSVDIASGGKGEGVGRAIVRGGVSIALTGGEICESVYGGGQGLDPSTKPSGDKYCSFVGSVFGNVTIVIDGTCHVGETVYGGGKGIISDNYSNVALVTGSVNITINKGTIGGSVFGGGAYGKLHGTSMGTIIIDIGNAEIGENVFGGGLGIKGKTSTFVSERTINIHGATIGGSVYGGSKEGDDNYSASSGFPGTEPTATCVINIVSGNIASGTSGNVYGGGYAGHAYFNSTINLGEPAATNMKFQSGGTLNVVSVFGGPNVGIRDPSQTTAPQLMKGNATVNIGGSGYTVGDFTITGDIFGGGDFCDVDGTRTVTINNFNQGDKKIQSIQKANDLTITDSKIRISGNVDGYSLDDSNRMSLNRIGMLTLRCDDTRTEIELDYAARSISGYSSEYVHDIPSDANGYNLIKMNNGKTFFILGENDGKNNEHITGGIHGNTLFQSDNNTYYGAFVIGDIGGSRDVDASFWISKNGIPELATTTDYNRNGGSGNDTRAWYISGSFRVEKTVVFDSGNSKQLENGGGSYLELDLDYVLPKISTDSRIWFMGYHRELNSPGSLNLVDSFDGNSVAGSDFILRFGQNPDNKNLVTFNEKQGVVLSDNLTSETKSDSGSKGLDMKMSIQTKPGYSSTGFVGSVIVHFAEVMEYKATIDGNEEVVSSIALGIFDVKVSIYLKVPSFTGSGNLDLDKDVIMRENAMGGYAWSGTTNIYLPAPKNSEVGYYAITEIYRLVGEGSNKAHETLNGCLAIRSVSNDEGKDGWIDANHRQTITLGNTLTGGEKIQLGTGAVYSPVLEVTYSTDPEDGLFDNVYVTVEIEDDKEKLLQRVTVCLHPIEVTKYKVTFYDKVLDNNGWMQFGDKVNAPNHKELFSINVEFGTTVHDYYVAYKNPIKSTGTTPGDAVDYLGDVRGLLMFQTGEVTVSTDKSTLESEAKTEGYLVCSVEEFLNIVIEKKPDTAYTGIDGANSKYVYKDNNLSWNNGIAGLSRFNFERPITQNQDVYSGYGVEITLRAIVNGEIRSGLISPSVIIPALDADSGKVTVDVEKWKDYVSCSPGYMQGEWYLDPYGNPISDNQEIYSSMTIYIKLTLITYEFSIDVVDEKDNSKVVEYNVFNGLKPLSKGDGGKYKFDVETDLRVVITANAEDPYYRVLEVSRSDICIVDGKSVKVVPQAENFGVIITVGYRYLVTVVLPTDGESDNDLFGFNDEGEVIANGNSTSHSFLVRGSESFGLTIPTYYPYGNGRGVVCTLYEHSIGEDGSVSKSLVGSPYGFSGIIVSLSSDMEYSLYVNIKWKVINDSDSGFTYKVRHMSDPLGSVSETEGVESDYVNAGDILDLRLESGYRFDSSFFCNGANWISSVGSDRSYVVIGGNDVVFGKAVSVDSHLTVIFEFLGDDNNALGLFRVYGSARLSLDGSSTVRVLAGGETDALGHLTFVIEDAVPGNKYSIEAGFAGFNVSDDSQTVKVVGDSSKEWKVVLSPVSVVMHFEDPKGNSLGDGDWNVTHTGSQNTLNSIYPDSTDYPAWSTGSAIIDSDDQLNVELFGIRNFYEISWSPVLKAIPQPEDLTTSSGLVEILILLQEDELEGEHRLSVDFNFNADLTVSGPSGPNIVSCTISDGKLVIENCPPGTGALRFYGGNAVVTVVSISVPEDIS